MEVHEFDKCLLDRLEESMNVLSWKDTVIPASQVNREWSYFIELQIEPAGWQALWKIPRVICEELRLRFPTMVFGQVEQVLFRELKAVFIVEAVQDDDVHIPEKHEVALVDLWPTLSQENTELNIEKTADCLDSLRFFYTNVWMPWDGDSDDDLNWVQKHLESRIRFCYDLRKRTIKRALAAHIRTLLIEARYIQQRREYLEIGLSDDEDLNSKLDKSNVTDLMRLHLRLAMIRSEVEMLENPEMRRIYEEINFDDEKHLKDTANTTCFKEKLQGVVSRQVSYIVTLPSTIKQQMQLLSLAQERIAKHGLVQICPSFQEVLGVCNASDSILLSPGRHPIKFLEYLNDNGIICGLTESKGVSNHSDSPPNVDVIIVSPDDDSILLIFDGDFTLENLVLDCQNIRTGIVIRNGKVSLKNCRLIGDGNSSTQRGLECFGSAELVLENCVLKNFATGITLNKGTSLLLNNTEISNCLIALDMNPNETKLICQSTTISDSGKSGIYVDSMILQDVESKSLVLKDLNDINKYASQKIHCSGECNFKNCKVNIYILNQSKVLISDNAMKYVSGDIEIDDSHDTSDKIVSSLSPMDTNNSSSGL